MLDPFAHAGASLSSEKLAIDRHWRNARTIASHNPAIFKLRAIGAHELNGEQLPYAWSAGVRKAAEQPGLAFDNLPACPNSNIENNPLQRSTPAGIVGLALHLHRPTEPAPTGSPPNRASSAPVRDA
ncbi:hypothetical protein [Bradyrhizobium sp. USDA 4454]